MDTKTQLNTLGQTFSHPQQNLQPPVVKTIYVRTQDVWKIYGLNLKTDCKNVIHFHLLDLHKCAILSR